MSASRCGRGLNENPGPAKFWNCNTLGVRGGYTQDDVTEFARALTGWTLPADDGASGVTAILSLEAGPARAWPWASVIKPAMPGGEQAGARHPAPAGHGTGHRAAHRAKAGAAFRG